MRIKKRRVRYACASVIDVTRTAHEMAVKTKGDGQELRHRTVVQLLLSVGWVA